MKCIETENNMKMCLLFMACLLPLGIYAAPITYTYDAQHRLVQASYSTTEKVFYNYDAAGNVDQHIVITDSKYLESWLLYFSLVEPRPMSGSAFLRLVNATVAMSGKKG